MKRFWKYLTGKKRIIAIAILVANSGLRAFTPELMTPEMHSWIDMAGSVIGGVGVWDAVQKNIKQSSSVSTKN